jgi:hypothetical protein
MPPNPNLKRSSAASMKTSRSAGPTFLPVNARNFPLRNGEGWG